MTTEPMTMKTETAPAEVGIDVQRLVRLDVLTPEFLYKALRPGMSWEINADKPHWEYEARKLQSAIIRHLEANVKGEKPCENDK